MPIPYSLAQLVDHGLTIQQIARIIGVSYPTAAKRLNRQGLHIKAKDRRGRLPDLEKRQIRQQQAIERQILRDKITQEKQQRNKEMAQMYLDGHTLEEVGQKYNITRERVRQLLVLQGVETRYTKQAVIDAQYEPKIPKILDLYVQGATIPQARAYNEAALRLHGEFARLNIFPDPIDGS